MGSIDRVVERAALKRRARDSGRTLGEQTAIEEAEKCDERSQYFNRIGSIADGVTHAKFAKEWRNLAAEIRSEELVVTKGKNNGYKPVL